MLTRSLPSLRLRAPAARALRSMSTADASAVFSHHSVKVAVSDDVQLHAFVPVDGDKNKTPVVCLPSAFGTSIAQLGCG